MVQSRRDTETKLAVAQEEVLQYKARWVDFIMQHYESLVMDAGTCRGNCEYCGFECECEP